MVFINMLTTVWKKEVDELRVSFKVQVRDLPPRQVVDPPLSVRGTPTRQPRGWASVMGGQCSVYRVIPGSQVTPEHPGSSMIDPVSDPVSNLVGDPVSDPVFDLVGDPVSDPVSPMCPESPVSASGGLWESLGLAPMSEHRRIVCLPPLT